MTFVVPPWRAGRIAVRIWHSAQVDSTQAEAKRLIAAGTAEGTLVLADAQSAGRGRLGRQWQSPPGNLYLSCILKPLLPLDWWGTLTLVAALAVAESADGYSPVRPLLKWPNDVQVDGKKIAGVLAEVADGWLLLGIGVNLNADLPLTLASATSLRHAAGRAIPRDEFLRDLVVRLDAYVQQAEHGNLFGARWTERMATLGRRVRLPGESHAVEGIAEWVRDDGALMVRQDDGTLAMCYGGEIQAADERADPAGRADK